jgi:hypothetical protein
MVTIFCFRLREYFLFFSAQWKERRLHEGGKKDTFLGTHFGNSKLGRDEAAKQEFPK